jgi:hypothetical protein
VVVDPLAIIAKSVRAARSFATTVNGIVGA